MPGKSAQTARQSFSLPGNAALSAIRPLLRLAGTPKRYDALVLLAAFIYATLLLQHTLRETIHIRGTDQLSMSDFSQDYLMAKAIRYNVPIYSPLSELAARFDVRAPLLLQHPTPHLPSLGIAVLPLSFLPLPTANAVWFCLQIICIVVCAHLMLRMWQVETSWARITLLAYFVLAWPGTPPDLLFGNVSLIIFALALAIWRLLQAGRPLAAGFMLGGSLLLKPMLWPILVWLLLRRQWSAVGAAILVGSVGAIATVLIVGWNEVITHSIESAKVIDHGYGGSVMNLSIGNLGTRLFRGVGSDYHHGVVAPPFIDYPSLATIASSGISLAAILLTLFAAMRVKDSTVAFALVLAVSAIAGPLSWIHYQVMVLPMFGAVLITALRQGYSPGAAFLIRLMIFCSLPITEFWLAIAFLLSGNPAGAISHLSPIASMALLAPTFGTVIGLGLMYHLSTRQQSVGSVAAIPIYSRAGG